MDYDHNITWSWQILINQGIELFFFFLIIMYMKRFHVMVWLINRFEPILLRSVACNVLILGKRKNSKLSRDVLDPYLHILFSGEKMSTYLEIIMVSTIDILHFYFIYTRVLHVEVRGSHIAGSRYLRPFIPNAL